MVHITVKTDDSKPSFVEAVNYSQNLPNSCPNTLQNIQFEFLFALQYSISLQGRLMPNSKGCSMFVQLVER